MRKFETILLCCKKCGSYEIRKGKFFSTFVCNSCNEPLNLHDIQFVEAEIAIPLTLSENKFIQQPVSI